MPWPLQQDKNACSFATLRVKTLFAGNAESGTDVHCNPLYSAAQMREIRREQALARVTRMLNAHLASSNGSLPQDSKARGFKLMGRSTNFRKSHQHKPVEGPIKLSCSLAQAC